MFMWLCPHQWPWGYSGVLNIIINTGSDFLRAADMAFQERNLRALEEVLERAGRQQEVHEHVNLLKEKLGQK